ncbi:MAG: hypothetical protein BSR46_01220 [Candidatus Dactylopiibacterium carminicum]|nr:MAG: hypothetical protein BSR46_01220 [Candidatus Dactylopiibacterium carminicum]
MRINRPLCLTAAALASTVIWHGAHAQTTTAAPATKTDAASDDGWKFMIGAGAANRPKYPGASERKTQFVPMISASYGRYFIGGVPGSGAPAGLGAHLYRSTNTRIGLAVGVGFSKARKESDDERLRGLGDIDNATRAALFASHTMLGWLTFAGSVSADVSGKDQGVLATFDVEGKYRVTERLALSAGPGLTWADSDYTQTFFGIDSGQSARSGLPTYTAKSGLNLLRFSVGAEYALDRQWGLAARASFARLQGDAADSPITASRAQNTYGIFATYRF